MTRLNADLERVFYSTQKDDRAERKPEVNADQSVSPAIRVGVCRVLNQALANCIDVALQCKQARWSVGGTGATTLAPLFRQMAIAADEYADRIAARIAALGGEVDGRLDSIAERSGLNKSPSHITRNRQHISKLTRDPRVLGMARQLLGGDGYIHQSRINDKYGFKGRGLNWHSDFET